MKVLQFLCGLFGGHHWKYINDGKECRNCGFYLKIH